MLDAERLVASVFVLGSALLVAALSLAACTLVAAAYDTRCTQDSDCVLVPPGGNVCEPCANGTGALSCDFSALNVSSAAIYRAALVDAQNAFKAAHPGDTDDEVCFFESCPTEGTAFCDAGTCASRFGP